MRKALAYLLLLTLLPAFCTTRSAAGGEQPVVRAAFFQSMPPFQFVDELGAASGIHIDILNTIAGQEGFSVVYLPFDTKSQCLEALEQGAADVVLGYQNTGYHTASNHMTSELSSASVSIVARRDLGRNMEDSSPERFFSAAFEYGMIDYSILYALGMNRFLGMESQAAAADALLTNDVDILVGLSESLSFLLEEKGAWDDVQVVHNQVSSINYTVLVRADNQRLHTLLDRKLIELRTSGAYDKIYNSWVPNRSLDQIQTTLRTVSIASGTVLSLIVLAAGIIARFNQILRHRVDEKTKMLSQANRQLEKQIDWLQNGIDFRNRMIDSVSAGIIVFKLDFSVTLMNPAARMLCNRALPVYADGLKAWDVPVFGPLLQQMKDADFQPSLNRSRILELGSGASAQKYRCWLYPLHEEDHFTGTLMMVENVTREEAKRQRMFEAEKEETLDRIVAGIAHEIRNPLMNVKTAVSLMLTQWENPKVREAFVQFIPDEVDRMNRLVESLLNYARPTSEEISVFPLSDVVNKCLYLAQITEKKNHIDFSVSLDDSLHVRAQNDLLRQTLINLLINSVWAVEQKRESSPDSTAEKAAITVQTRREQEWAVLSVRDEGIGMSPEAISRCTNPFYTTKQAGTGLGLALARQFADDNGGILTIRSEENTFTEILIYLKEWVCE